MSPTESPPATLRTLPALRHDIERYVALTDREIEAELVRHVGGLLLRGSLAALLARREIGGLLYAVAKHYPGHRGPFEAVARRRRNLEYSEARRHVQLWVNWSRCLVTLERLEANAKRLRTLFFVPGLRRLLRLAGVTVQRGGDIITLAPPDMPIADPLPDDVAVLKAIIRRLMSRDRVQRAKSAVLQGLWLTQCLGSDSSGWKSRNFGARFGKCRIARG